MTQFSFRSISLKKHRQAFPNHGGEKSVRLKYLERLIGHGEFTWFDWRVDQPRQKVTVNKAKRSEAWLNKHRKKIKGR